jgi:RNA-directed DNA polymerase
MLDEDLLKSAYHALDKTKAVGVDGVTKGAYGSRFKENIKDLLDRLRRGTYRPQPSRRVQIPKEDGSTRPLAISCFEDKVVQSAVKEILTQIYEPIFHPSSYGYRPGRGCHDALRALMKHTYPCWNGAVVEIDIQQYFDTIPHKELQEILRKKITDDRFLRLIDKLAKAPIQEKGKSVANTEGCPQGSILSPILANIFLHEVIDDWFEKIKKTHFVGRAEEVRYADDMVFVFERYSEAKRFFEVLPKRLAKYGLKVQQKKSRLLRSGQNAAERARRQGKRLPTYKFLGFTVYWGKARNGKWWRMKYRSHPDRFRAKLKGLKRFLRKELTTADTTKTLETVVRGVVGWINYHAISDNEVRVRQFLRASRWITWRWINRRGRRRPMNWTNFMNVLERLNFPQRVKTTSMFEKAC